MTKKETIESRTGKAASLAGLLLLGLLMGNAAGQAPMVGRIHTAATVAEGTR